MIDYISERKFEALHWILINKYFDLFELSDPKEVENILSSLDLNRSELQFILNRALSLHLIIIEISCGKVFAVFPASIDHKNVRLIW